MSTKKKLVYYNYDETKETVIQNSDIDYEPINFLRAHSKNNDIADLQTSVWQCAFEPDPYNSKQITNTLATCGGNSICFIDLTKGIVKKKFNVRTTIETIYTIAWTTLKLLDGNFNILVGGGYYKTLYFLDPEKSVIFYEYKFKINSKSVLISALLFHPIETNVLFCGLNDGRIFIMDIGTPQYPNYNCEIKHLYILNACGEINSFCYSVKSGMFLTATSTSINGWLVTSKPLSLKSEPKKYNFNIKLNSKKYDNSKIVDSIEILDNDYIACKIALHGCIYIWDLIHLIKNNPEETCFQCTPRYTLKWSDTDNFYLNMGSCTDLLACGDDKGAIWLYNITQIFSSRNTNHEPIKIISWPEVNDRYLRKKGKLNIDTYDIVLNKTIFSPNGKYLITITANNMVCIWLRTSSD